MNSSVEAMHAAAARQHALFVELLPEPIRSASIAYYLVFRMIDTIEDYLPDEDATDILDEATDDPWRALCEGSSSVLAHPGVPDAYRALFERRSEIERALGELPVEFFGPIEETGREMAAGMLKFRVLLSEARRKGSGRHIATFEELDEYCHAVAGCVGVLNTRLFAIAGVLESEAASALETAGADLGNYLQLVNILRDFAADAAVSGRILFPREIESLSNIEQLHRVIGHARNREDAIEHYLGALPRGGVRSYCRTLHRIARLHFDWFASAQDVLERGARIPAWRMFAALPPELMGRFLLHKLQG